MTKPKLFSTHALFEEPQKRLAAAFDTEFWTALERPSRAELLSASPMQTLWSACSPRK